VASDNVPVAVNCCVKPLGTVKVGALTTMDATCNEVSVASPGTPSNVARIVAAPGAVTAVAKPFDAITSLTVPIVGSKDVQVAKEVRFCVVVPSVRTPVAANCCVVPGAMLAGDTGVTPIDWTCNVLSVVVPVMPLEAAVMVDVPILTRAVAKPRGPDVLLNVIILVSEELQVVDDVMLRVLPFENVPVAVSCEVDPGAMLEFTGVTNMETSVAEVPELGELVPQPDTNAERRTVAMITTQAPKLFFMMFLREYFAQHSL
jgi:hypothetical protein